MLVYLFMTLFGVGNVAAQNGLGIAGFIDTNACTNSLKSADENKNEIITDNEYASFVRLQDLSGTFKNITMFDELPFTLQSTFFTLCCMCSNEDFGGDPNDTDCCLASDSGIVIREPTNTGERTRLFATCYLTEMGINEVLASERPTSIPTILPTKLPSVSPTMLPSRSPTTLPTGSPTSSPTRLPTRLPTRTPTKSPTVIPSKIPIDSPLDPPTGVPSLQPMSIPTLATSTMPSSNPTEVPTDSPEMIQLSTPVLINYDIVVKGIRAHSKENYKSGLVLAMDRLAPEVANEVFGSHLRRFLVVNVKLPTSIKSLQSSICPEGYEIEDGALCESVEAEIILTSLSSEEYQLNIYRIALQKAVNGGRLQENLEKVSKDNEVYILAEREKRIEPGQSNWFSSSVAVGVIIAALIGVSFSIILYAVIRKRYPEKPGYDAYEAEEPFETEAEDKIATKAIRINPSIEKKNPDLGTLGAIKPNYGKPSNLKEAEMNIEDCVFSGDSSSNAGSSGWSSSAGLSSLNTGSHDDSFDPIVQLNSLAMIGAASGISHRADPSFEDGVASVKSQSNVSRQDLDSAIEAGDWAAVGATAALLSAASDSLSAGSRTSGGKSGGTSVSSIDAARVVELDHLVDAGDWEGVVLAAAKYESVESVASGSIRSGTASSVRTTGSSTMNGSSTGSGTYSRSISTSISESPSKTLKREKIRGEVEVLVQRVVPEEFDNVDEMMLQFRGREEELVETLRTMQERDVAKKARAAGQKAAKQEARRNVRRGVVQGKKPPIAPRSYNQSDRSRASTGTGSAVASSAVGSDMSALQMRSALEVAIEAGDWEAVGEAAAMMSDNSLTSASTMERDCRAKGQFSPSSSVTSNPRPLKLTGVNVERAQELDDMIDRGDWSGVVTAAGRFSKADREMQSDSSLGDSSSRKRSNRDSEQRKKRLREEADALAQAEIWMAIAEQSKNEGSIDLGARDAADWAIARSLSRLRQAEGTVGAASINVARSPQSSNQSQNDDESV